MRGAWVPEVGGWVVEGSWATRAMGLGDGDADERRWPPARAKRPLSSHKGAMDGGTDRSSTLHAAC